MKKAIFLFLAWATAIAVQGQQSPKSTITLSKNQNKRYFELSNQYFTKIKGMPANCIKTVESNTVLTKEKSFKDKVYSIAIDSALKTRNDVVTSLTFYVRPTHAYFPLEILTYQYDHVSSRGILVYHTHQRAGSRDVYNTNEREVRETFEQLVLMIDQVL